MKIFSHLLISLIAVSAISANAALYDRGNGMIYDSGLNITWLQDVICANIYPNCGYQAMTWAQAKTAADNIEHGGFSDWRLPSARLFGGVGDNPSYNGTTDYGYYNTHSELGHLYSELGGKPFCSLSDGYECIKNPEWTRMPNSTFIDGSTGLSVSFLNLNDILNDQARMFWEMESFQLDDSSAYTFQFSLGRQSGFPRTIPVAYAWMVRDGDVAPVPVPAAAWLMGSGLIGLAGIARRKKNK